MVNCVSTHADQILAIAVGSLTIEKVFHGIVVNHPHLEHLAMTFRVIGSEAEFFVERSDDMSKIG